MLDFEKEAHNTPDGQVTQLHGQSIFVENQECSICYETLTTQTFIQLQCTHYYCNVCITECIKKQYTKCALCRTEW